ncbi:TetR family transcriptional regulator [Brevundimonas sp. LM2]|uniref:TetR/AcrR family transcriptional regulator n=1 Tax=Brevundimonas sp. LM2 TaxID=1938605 RepID=UPI000983FD7E|nr:TetR/AcrR family transcriptional regulator [Brevundimonas sp. LM2]AQR62178.1 TetR family transcriptional regulator [Brevundimonas sp. LM2]
MSEQPASPAVAPVRGGRKPKGEGHARRAEILEAAERVFVEVGYDGATIRRIADEVGLSSTALYMHFSEKSEILHEICRCTFARLQALNESVMAEPGCPQERLRRLMEAYVAFGFDNPNAYRLTYLTRPIEARDGAQTAAQSLGGDLFRAFESVVADVAAEGHLRGDAKTAAQTLWAGIHGVVSLMITKPYFDWVGREALTKSMIDTLIAGLLRP